MRRSPIILIVFIVLVAAVVGASYFLRSQPPLEINVAVSPLAESWVRSAVDAYNATEPVVNAARRVHYNVTPIDDMSVWSDAGQRSWTPDSHPAAWVPAASFSLDYADRLPFEVVEPSLAQTVLTWGGFSDRVNALTDDGARPLDWSEVKTAADAGRWASLDPSLDGNVNLAFSKPDGSISGLAALFSGAAAFGDQAAISGATVVANDFHNWMQPVLESVPNFNTLGASVAKTLATRGTATGDLALLPESEWLNNLTGTLKDASNPIQLSYPAFPFVFDFPLARYQGMTADENAAVDGLARWLLAQHPEDFGLRPASGVVPPTAAKFAAAQDYGAQLEPDLTQSVQAPPRSDTQRLLTWVGQTVR